MDHNSQGLKIIIRNSDGTSSDITMYSNDGKMPSTIEIGGAMKAADVKVSEIDAAEREALIEKQDSKDPESGAGLTTHLAIQEDPVVGIYSTIQESPTALCSLVTIVIMIMTLVKYYSTSHIAGAWPTNPKLYPTYLLLITSLITLVIDVFSLGERYCGASGTKKTDTMISKMRHALPVLQAIGSATGVGVFKGTQAAGSGQDLFGWTCSGAADQMASVNSSDLICSSNTNSATISILQAALHALGIVITVVTVLKPKSASPEDSEDKRDEESGTNTGKMAKHSSCGSCGKPISGWKPDEKKPRTNTETPNVNSRQNEVESKSGARQVDQDVTKSIFEQSQALYARLQPNKDPQDFSYYGELDLNSTREDHYAVDMNGAQTGYADVEVAYDGFGT